MKPRAFNLIAELGGAFVVGFHVRPDPPARKAAIEHGVDLRDYKIIYDVIDDVKRPVAVSDFLPRWHAKSKTLLGTGHTVVYTPKWKVTHPRPRHTSFSTYDPGTNQWAAWKKLAMPKGDKFHDS